MESGTRGPYPIKITTNAVSYKPQQAWSNVPHLPFLIRITRAD